MMDEVKTKLVQKEASTLAELIIEQKALNERLEKLVKKMEYCADEIYGRIPGEGEKNE